ncbi:hypothetical protein [Flavobacterium psychrophilum]|uniref:hypothetical protein n=1 Tax=Flavobacterium psychrophilum TaxID=96345 RepID=UPI0010696A73|nr:hypothetical protein [Flavobacterium psychrophilum]
MKKLLSVLFVAVLFISCKEQHQENQTAAQEQAHTETNQSRLNQNQPLPDITWSMERDNLIKLKKLQNDRTVTFFMYVFIEGISEPIGYYQVNKVSSVNSQLSNPEQIISGNKIGNDLPAGTAVSIPSPSEDGSYGTNGDAVFGFTPEYICIETNMKFICATVPLHFQKPVNRLAIIDTDQAKQLLEASKKAMK